MIDINRLIGFVFYSNSYVTFQRIRESLVQMAKHFDIDDVAVILGEFCHGIGPITAGLANATALGNGEDFIEEIKATVKEIGSVEMDEPKIIFVISDHYSEKCQRNIRKMHKMNEQFGYNAQISVLQISGGSGSEKELPRIFVDDTEELVKEIKRVLGEQNANI